MDLSGLLEWLSGLWQSLVNLLQDFFFWVVNSLIQLFGTVFHWAINLLPTYILPTPDINWSGFPVLSTIAYFFPVSFALKLFSSFAAAVVVYFTVGTVLRWLRISR